MLTFVLLHFMEATRQAAIPYYPGNSDPLEKALFILQDAIVLLNRKGKITFINQAGQQILSGDSGSLPAIGDDYLSLLGEDKKEITSHHIDKAFCNQPSM